jgi:spermidine synthase
MDLWLERSESPGAKWGIRVSRPLFSTEGKAGRVEVLETADFGRALTVGGALALTEGAGFVQREMLAHAPLAVHPNARSVLIIGGLDLGTALEALRYPQIERLVLVEEDDAVVEAQRRFFPALAQALSDPRLSVAAEEAEAFVRDSKERFDLAIVQAPGPEAAQGERRFDQGFWCDCFRILSGDGILVAPAGGAYYPARRRELVGAAGRIKRLFPTYRPYLADSPDAEGGSRILSFASKKYDPLRDFDPERWKRRAIKALYYDADVHRAAFALPPWIAEIIEEA